MSLAARQRQVTEAEARLVNSSEQLRRSWSGLKQEGNAALTPGRVVVSGMLSGYFSGVLVSGRHPTRDSNGQRDSGQSFSLLLALIQLAGTLLPQLLPSIAPAFRAGMAAGAGPEPQEPSTPKPESSDNNA